MVISSGTPSLGSKAAPGPLVLTVSYRATIKTCPVPDDTLPPPTSNYGLFRHRDLGRSDLIEIVD